MSSKLFGFASCPRAVGAAEGMNVLAERRMQQSPAQGEPSVQRSPCHRSLDMAVRACSHLGLQWTRLWADAHVSEM